MRLLLIFQYMFMNAGHVRRANSRALKSVSPSLPCPLSVVVCDRKCVCGDERTYIVV